MELEPGEGFVYDPIIDLYDVTEEEEGKKKARNAWRYWSNPVVRIGWAMLFIAVIALVLISVFSPRPETQVLGIAGAVTMVAGSLPLVFKSTPTEFILIGYIVIIAGVTMLIVSLTK